MATADRSAAARTSPLVLTDEGASAARPIADLVAFPVAEPSDEAVVSIVDVLLTIAVYLLVAGASLGLGYLVGHLIHG